MSLIKLKVSLNNIDERQNILEIVKQLQGEIFLEYDKLKQDALIQTQNYIIDQNNIFHLNDQNKFLQDPLSLQDNQYFNEAVGISTKIKFIVIHNLMKNHFYQKAKQFQMKIFPDWNLSEYKTKEKLNAKKLQLLEQINQEINNIILFSVYCKNPIEKNSKKNFLFNHFEKLATILEANQGNLFLGEVEEPYEFARQLNNLIFIVNLNENAPQNNYNFLILQKQILLNRFICDNFKSHAVVISIAKPKCTRAELKEMAQDFCKQYQNVNIKVGYNRFEIPTFVKIIYIEIESYNDLFNVDQVFQQEIQDRASKVLRLNEWEKLHFERFICKLPLITNPNINFKVCERGIKLNTTFHLDKQFRNYVNKLLESLKRYLIYLKVDAKLSNHLELISIQQKKHILTKLFLDFTQQQNILYINDIKFQYIEVAVYLNEFLNNDLVNLENYLNETLTKLEVKSFQMNQLNQLGLTPEEFQEKYSALMYVQNQQLYFILHSKYLNEIKNKLDSYKTLIYLYYKPKSKLYAQQIFHDYKNKIMEQSEKILSIKLSSNQEIVYFESPSYDMTVLSTFNKYEQKLDQLLIEIPIKISKLGVKFLHNNCQKEIQKLCQEYLFEFNFNFSEEKIPNNQQKIQEQGNSAILQFMKFQTKEVYFDTNLKCDIFLKMIPNNNSDLKIAYKKEDKIRPNALDIQQYFLFIQKQKVPYQQIGVVFEEIKDIFPILLKYFMSKGQTKFQQLLIFIDNDRLQSQYEQELVMTLVNSMQKPYQDVQWQWCDGTKFNDFEGAMINEQIEAAYQAYIKDNKKNQLLLKFPFSCQPGTHKIDLNQCTILDRTNAEFQQMKSVVFELFYIKQGQADDFQIEYIQEKISMMEYYQFTEYFKKYQIVFQTKDEIYQINLDSKLKRILRREIQTDQYFSFVRNFLKQKLNVETCKLTLDDNHKYCSAKTFLRFNQETEQVKYKKTEEINNAIQKILEKYVTYFEIKLPIVNDQIHFSFLKYLQNNTLQMDGVLIQNQTVYIKSFEKNRKSIQEVAEFIGQIPQSWNACSYKSLYNIDDLQFEQEEVKQSFPFLNIKTIQLIQNYDIWAQYLSTKRSLGVWDEQLLLFGSQKDCPQEIFGRVTLSLSFDYQKGPYIKCGNTMTYIKDNYYESSKGEKQIIIVQVLLGQPQDLKQQYVISDYAIYNYKEGQNYYVQKNRIYPKFLITLNEQ